MIVKQLGQYVRIKEFFGRFGGKSLLHTCIIFVFFQPYADWYRKSELFLLGGLAADGFLGGASQSDFCPRSLDFVLYRKCLCKFHDFLVQEGDAHFKGICHAHLVPLH